MRLIVGLLFLLFAAIEGTNIHKKVLCELFEKLTTNIVEDPLKKKLKKL